MRPWALLGAAIAMEVSATLSLRAAIDSPAFYVIVVLGYSGSFVALALTLKSGLPMGVSYGIWAAVGITLTAVGGSVLFGDHFTPVMAIGIATVGLGVFILHRGRQDLAPPEVAVALEAEAEAEAS